MYSIVVRHPMSITQQAPVVFIQYLAAMAVVEAVRQDLPETLRKKNPVRLKWPNDIYAMDPKTSSLTKIGGVLVNSHYSSTEYLCVVGVGLNLNNEAPTTSLSRVLAATPGYPSQSGFRDEALFARILVTFSGLYELFKHKGWDGELERIYLDSWLHGDQIVHVDGDVEGAKVAEEGCWVRVLGITRDWGLLRCEECDESGGWKEGKEVQLQPDGNSFDFFRGLLRRKV